MESWPSAVTFWLWTSGLSASWDFACVCPWGMSVIREVVILTCSYPIAPCPCDSMKERPDLLVQAGQQKTRARQEHRMNPPVGVFVPANWASPCEPWGKGDDNFQEKWVVRWLRFWKVSLTLAEQNECKLFWKCKLGWLCLWPFSYACTRG